MNVFKDGKNKGKRMSDYCISSMHQASHTHHISFHWLLTTILRNIDV